MRTLLLPLPMLGGQMHRHRWQAASEFGVPMPLAAEIERASLVVYVLGEREAELPLSERCGCRGGCHCLASAAVRGRPDQAAQQLAPQSTGADERQLIHSDENSSRARRVTGMARPSRTAFKSPASIMS